MLFKALKQKQRLSRLKVQLCTTELPGVIVHARCGDKNTRVRSHVTHCCIQRTIFKEIHIPSLTLQYHLLWKPSSVISAASKCMTINSGRVIQMLQIVCKSYILLHLCISLLIHFVFLYMSPYCYLFIPVYNDSTVPKLPIATFLHLYNYVSPLLYFSMLPLCMCLPIVTFLHLHSLDSSHSYLRPPGWEDIYNAAVVRSLRLSCRAVLSLALSSP